MPNLTAKQANFVSRAIDICENINGAIDDLDDLKREWDDLGYAGTFTPEAFGGNNAHLDIGDLANLAAAQQSLANVMNGGVRAVLLAFRR